MTMTARYTSELSEIDVQFEAGTIEIGDGSTEADPDSVDVSEIYICGVKVDFTALPNPLQIGILELAGEVEFE